MRDYEMVIFAKAACQFYNDKSMTLAKFLIEMKDVFPQLLEHEIKLIWYTTMEAWER